MMREAVAILLATAGACSAFIAGGLVLSPRPTRGARVGGWLLFAAACLLLGAAVGWAS